MNLLMTEWITDREWSLAWDITRLQEQGGPLSLRELSLGEIAGSPERALRILATVRRYRNDITLGRHHQVPGHHHRHAPRRHSGSSVTSRTARRTANARAVRQERLAHWVTVAVTVAFTVYVLWGITK
jgi:hypothetical protein